MNSVETQRPFQIVGLDFIGRLAKTKGGNEHLLVAIDYFSKWVVSKPTANTSAATVAEFIINQIVCQYGAPESVLCDNGSGFTAKLVEQITKLIGINKINCTPYHSKGNALVERCNQTIQDKIAMIINAGDDQAEWDVAAPLATFAMNTTRQQATGYMPFKVIFGRIARLPQDPLNSTNSEIDYVKSLATRIELVRRYVNSNLIEQGAVNKERYDGGRRESTFKVNDTVMTYFPPKSINSSIKLSDRYAGPYTIMTDMGNNI